MAAIRPVDMQVMVQRTPELNRLTNNDGSRAETQQNQFSQEFQRLSEHAQRTVVQAQETEGRDVDKDGSAGKEKEQKKKRRPTRRQDDSEEEKQKDDLGSGMLDIMM